jgi:hypothetical protein
LSGLSAGEEAYSFSRPDRRSRELLRESVARFGLLRPLLALGAGGGPRIVAGARRLQALAAAGAETAPLRFVDRLGPRELWDLLLEDQLVSGPLNVVELGTYARKRAAATGEGLEELAGRVLPRLGLPPRAGALDDALWAAALPPKYQDLLAEGGFPPHGLRVLARGPAEDALALLDFFEGTRPGVNRFLELARQAIECAWGEGLAVRDWLAREGLRPPGTPAELEEVRRAIRRRRFPTVCRWEETFDADVRTLGLRERVRFAHPPGFEGRLTCTLSFASLEELRRGAEELLGAAAEGRLSPLTKYLE